MSDTEITTPSINAGLATILATVDLVFPGAAAEVVYIIRSGDMSQEVTVRLPAGRAVGPVPQNAGAA